MKRLRWENHLRAPSLGTAVACLPDRLEHIVASVAGNNASHRGLASFRASKQVKNIPEDVAAQKLTFIPDLASFAPFSGCTAGVASLAPNCTHGRFDRDPLLVCAIPALFVHGKRFLTRPN
jgi:hypothetical protein